MKLKKFTILLVVLTFLSIGLFAQFSVNADVVVPTASNSNMYLGISGTYLHDVNGALSIGGNTGFRMLLKQNVTGFQIPIMADVRYYVNSANNGFYPEALIGLMISHYSVSLFGLTSSTTQTNFALAFGAGYKIDDAIDISARFEIIPVESRNTNCVGFRVGYWF